MAGYLHRVHHAVYTVGHGSLSLYGKYWAAVLAGGTAAALSHRSAADLWDLVPGAARIAITVPHGRGGLPRTLEVHRTRMLDARDFTERDGIPVTTVSRTLLDIAGVASRRRLALAVSPLGARPRRAASWHGRRTARRLRVICAGT
jgi:hypothetical protein